MKILIHHRTQGKGVEAVHIRGIASGMEACGHAVKIVSPPGAEVSPDGKKKGAVGSVARRAPQIFFECLELLHNLAAFSLLARAKKDFGCDLIYERYAFLGAAGSLAARAWKVPLALEVNYTMESDLAVRSRTKALSPLTRLCEAAVFKSAALLLPVSTRLAHDIEAHGLSGGRVLVSPNAADLSSFCPNHARSEGLRHRLFVHRPEIVIGFVGSFAPWHRVDMLMNACASAAGHTGMRLGLMLVGEGGNRHELEARAAGVPGNLEVVFPGFAPHSRLPEYIASMDIAVMPHSNDYGSPMKVYEYMAMGRPVVAPDLGPLRDALAHGREGLLFRPGSIDDLAGAILDLVRNPELRRKLGRNARIRAESEHNWKSRCEIILDALGIRPSKPASGPAAAVSRL